MDSLIERNAVVDGREVRASDEDRERAASALREHFALGRIDADELAARLERAYGAGTERELQALRADLPRLPPTDAERRRRLARRTGVELLPFAVCTLVWLVSGANGSFWPIWVGLASLLHRSRRSLLHRR